MKHIEIDGIRQRVFIWIRQGKLTNPAPLIWIAALCVVLSSTIALNLWMSRKVALYEVMLILAFTTWMWLLLPRLSARLAENLRIVAPLVLVSGYTFGNFALALYSNSHAIRLTADFGVFLQSLYWTLHGLPLFNTMDGTSHLGVHASFLLFGIIPFYTIWPFPSTLLFIQAISLGLGGWIFYTISRRYLDEFASLLLLGAFLFFPAYQFDLGDFYESSLAVPFILLVVDSALRHRWLILVLSGVLLMSIKETFPLMLLAFGIYLLLCKRPRFGIAAIVLGALGFYIEMAILIPWFRETYAVFPTDYKHFRVFAPFGDSLGTILLNMVVHPSTTLWTILEPGKPEYLLKLLAPYLIFGFAGSMIWIIALPELVISLLSSLSQTNLLAGARFSMVTSVALALSVVFSLRRISGRVKSIEQAHIQRLFASAMLFSTLSLLPTWLNSTHLTPGATAIEVPTILARVGNAAAVALPQTIVLPFAQRAVVFDIDRNPPEVVSACSEYVVVRHDHRPERTFTLISSNGFHEIWEGTEFELWKSPTIPSCSPRLKPWTEFP